MKRLILGLMLLLSACATTGRSLDDRIVSTLYISNLTGGFVTVSIAETGWRLGSAFTMTECIKIYESDIAGASDLLSFRFEIGRSDGFITQAVPIESADWAIRIGNSPSNRHIDSQSLGTAERCK